MNDMATGNNTALTELSERLRRVIEAEGAGAIASWRLNLTHSNVIKVGIDSNHLGGPYSAPRNVDQLVGEVFIVWKDGRRTIARVDPGSLANPDLAGAWKGSAFADPDQVDVLSPAPMPKVDIFSEKVSAAVQSPGSEFFAPLTQYAALKGQAQFINAGVNAAVSRSVLLSSAGHDLAWSATDYSTSIGFDSLYDDYYTGCAFPEPGTIEAMIDRVARRYGELSTAPRGWLASGEMEVLLEPDVVEGLIGHYLLGNMLGSNVANGQSAYRPEDFGSRHIVREDLSLRLEPLRPLHPGSYVCTREGVPAAELTLVDKGLLVSPILDVKYANRLGKQPTPLANGTDSLVLHCPLEKETQIMQGDAASMLVCSVLGLHTQDPTSGNFSLTAGQALEVQRDGSVGGKIKAVFSGNLFNALNEKSTRFARVPGKDFPMMRLRCRVTLE